MYTIKTKKAVIKPIDNLSQQEIEEAIEFNNNKKKLKIEKIEQAKKELEQLEQEEQEITLSLLDLAESKDLVQRRISAKRKFIDDETYIQRTIEKILLALSKEYSAEKHFVEYSCEVIEKIQTED